MSDAALAAVSGLLGVALSGGVQVGLEVWRDHKNRRPALRPVEDEITTLATVLTLTRGEPGAISKLPQPHQWRTHRELLSRELPDRKWHRVSGAYAMYDILLDLDTMFKQPETKEAEAILEELLGKAVELLDLAHQTLSRRRCRGARRTTKSIAKAVKESRSA